MKRLNGRRMILWIMTLVLCVTTCVPAFASVGDRTLIRGSRNGSGDVNIRGILPLGDGFCIITDGMNGQSILKYANIQSEPEKFVKPSWEPSEDMEGLMEGEGELNAEAEGLPEANPEGTEEGTAVPAVSEENGEKTETPAAQEEPQEEMDFFADMDWAAEDENGMVINQDPEDAGFEDDHRYEYIQNYFSWNDELYGLAEHYVFDEETQTGSTSECYVRHVKLENGEIITEDSDIPNVDTSFLVIDEAQHYYTSAQSVFTVGDNLIMTYYGNSSGIGIAAVNLKNGTLVSMPEDDTISDVIPGPEGSVFLIRREFKMEGSTFRISRLDLETQNEEPVTEVNTAGYQLTACYDREKNTIYYVCDGELFAQPMAEGQQAESVNECGIMADGLLATADGYIIAWTYSAALARNTDPTKRANVTLRVSNSGSNWQLEDAVLDMNESRGDMSVVLKSMENSISSDVLQAMMNQEDYIDVYILSYESKEFDALRNRNYLTDLSDNKDIAAAVDRMYPYFQEAVKQDGKIICTPVQLTGQVLGVNLKTWAKLGGTEEELPKTWGQLLDWLEKDVPERLVGSDGIKVCDSDGMSLKGTMRLLVLYQYQMWMDAKGGEYQFNTPFLKDLLSRIDNLNTDALGMKEEFDEEDYGIIYGGMDTINPLLQTYAQPTAGGNWGGYVPMILGFEENEEPIVGIEMTAGFVNPYSKHPEEAREFLALIMKNMDTTSNATLFTDKAEPVLNEYNKDWVESTRQWVEEVEERLKKAEEGEEKEDLERSLEDAKAQYEMAQEYLWDISPDDIAIYHKNLPNLKVMDYLFLYDLFNTGDQEERMSIYGMFYGSDANTEQLLDMLDKKITTIRKEGN